MLQDSGDLTRLVLTFLKVCAQAKKRRTLFLRPVVYKAIVHWQPSNPLKPPSRLEVPFLLQPEVNFQCVDTSAKTSWLELPLKYDRPLPFRAAITLPTPMAFSCFSFIPYFVAFTTTPRSPALVKEIAADATISVSLIRQVIVNESSSLSSTTPLKSSSDDTEFLLSLTRFRIRKSQPKLGIMLSRDKLLQDLPVQKSFFDMQTIHKDMCIEFPKRSRRSSRNGSANAKTRLPKNAIAAIPDGLHKTRIQLNRDMLPSIDWAGISVKYYLDVSVLLGLDELRARIPIRIF